MKKKFEEFVPQGKLVQVPDFLPPPSELINAKITVKVTLGLSKESIDFFKREAKKNNVKYQAMIREVVDLYARMSSLSNLKNGARKTT